jgi:hypothetical protein
MGELEMIMGADPRLVLELDRRRGAEMRATAERHRLARQVSLNADRHDPKELSEDRRPTGWAWLGRRARARTAQR